MSDVDAEPHDRGSTRGALVEVAADLLREGGLNAVTTRAVAIKAGVQAPTIYRLFGSKDGLLDAIVEHVVASYVDGDASHPDNSDPVSDLAAAWETHIRFGLTNPDVFRLLSDPTRQRPTVPLDKGRAALAERVKRIAAAGRLNVPERRAVDLIHAAGTGVVLTLLAMPENDRDNGLAGAIFQAIAGAILRENPVLDTSDTTAAVVSFRTVAAELAVLTDAERALLVEWLDRAT